MWLRHICVDNQEDWRHWYHQEVDCNYNLLRIQNNVKGCLKRNSRLVRNYSRKMIVIFLELQNDNKICVYLPILIWHKNFFRCLQDAMAIGTVVFDPATIQFLPLPCKIFGAGNFNKLFSTGIKCPKHVIAIIILLNGKLSNILY